MIYVNKADPYIEISNLLTLIVQPVYYVALV